MIISKVKDFLLLTLLWIPLWLATGYACLFLATPFFWGHGSSSAFGLACTMVIIGVTWLIIGFFIIRDEYKKIFRS
jgi:hypothetical protein